LCLVGLLWVPARFANSLALEFRFAGVKITIRQAHGKFYFVTMDAPNESHGWQAVRRRALSDYSEGNPVTVDCASRYGSGAWIIIPNVSRTGEIVAVNLKLKRGLSDRHVCDTTNKRCFPFPRDIAGRSTGSESG
jgi:hypothetical protein